ncbi:MAG TPA: histidine kinase dimerization/phospho-acceptor domain-containing protein [Candidatus Acidoferrales bacterium]|nr:histidine kinase dimerization/phospho-acceptor domain-containing protein [Candidatus Acidoferrales bacterium]
MMRRPAPTSGGPPARVLLVGLLRAERECLQRTLGGDARLQLRIADSVAEALPRFEAGEADIVVCDLSFYLLLQESGEVPDYDPVSRPTLVLVSLGEERRLGEHLELDPTDFLLRAGDYCQWLPAGVRRLRRRRQTQWEEVAALLRHEINNPLTGVLGNAELVLAEASALPEKTRHRLATIIQLAVRLRDVVRNLESQLARSGNGAQHDCAAAGAVRLPRPVVR